MTIKVNHKGTHSRLVNYTRQLLIFKNGMDIFSLYLVHNMNSIRTTTFKFSLEYLLI